MLRTLGSLWFAAVLLMLFLVGMACATVYESMYGAARALAEFYTTWWFTGILALIGVNALASMLIRYPFSKRQLAFVLTHLGILVTLGGALVTVRYGTDGYLSLFEEQSADALTLRDGAMLAVRRRGTEESASVALTARTFDGFRVVERPKAPILQLGELRVEVERFVPDSEVVARVTDDYPGDRPAVEVSLSASGEDAPKWLFDGEPDTVGGHEALFRIARDGDELERLLSASRERLRGSGGLVKVEYEGSLYEVPLDQGLSEAVPLGDTGATARVLRYLPHALVEGKQLVNKSNRPVNPAVEVEVVSPSGTAKRYAFANFPEFASMHGKSEIEGLKVTFVAPSEAASRAPLEVIGGLAGDMFARFVSDGDHPVVVHELEVGVPLASPWPGKQFTVLRRFEHARVGQTIRPVSPPRETCQPALLLKMSAADHTDEVWVQKFGRTSAMVAGAVYELVYRSRTIPLGFELTLDRFHMTRYPGTAKPRTFESHITIRDPAATATHSPIVSMNRPVVYGGYSFYQSSYSQDRRGPSSVLSVSRDPGKPIVFAGYIIMLVGMVLGLGLRIGHARKTERAPINRGER